MMDLEVKCPKKGCSGYAQASVSYGEGNTEGPCDECSSQVGFHYTVEFDGVYLARDCDDEVEEPVKRKKKRKVTSDVREKDGKKDGL